LTDTGCGSGRLCPRGSLKRWEMAVWLVRVLDEDEPDPELASRASFGDVEKDVWWAAHVERLFEMGVTVGCSAETLQYCPDESVTRAQMSSFLVRAFGFEHAEPAGFTDVGTGSHYRDINTLYAVGVTVGCSRSPLRYCPSDPTSREQMASFLTRAQAALRFGDLHDGGTSHIGALVNLTLRDALTDTGCDNSILCPREMLTRWEMAVWLVRLLDGKDPEPATETRFVDVDVDNWWAPHVERLADLGVTLGCAQTPRRYCPHDPVPRKQMASFLVRAFNIAPADPANFTDVTPTDTHSKDINALYAAGVTYGCTNTPLRYCPDQPTTKAQMASFITRAKLLTQLQPPTNPTNCPNPTNRTTTATTQTTPTTQTTAQTTLTGHLKNSPLYPPR
nr:S-layer homology domain-containing protein [Acidimicrobiia bacterium]